MSLLSNSLAYLDTAINATTMPARELTPIKAFCISSPPMLPSIFMDTAIKNTAAANPAIIPDNCMNFFKPSTPKLLTDLASMPRQSIKVPSIIAAFNSFF